MTTIDKNTFDPKSQTFSLENPSYTMYINIGMWKSLEHFDNAIKEYFPNASSNEKGDGKIVYTIELEDFEFKIRERIVLKKTEIVEVGYNRQTFKNN